MKIFQSEGHNYVFVKLFHHNALVQAYCAENTRCDLGQWEYISGENIKLD
jgi:hypothetical protein